MGKMNGVGMDDSVRTRMLSRCAVAVLLTAALVGGPVTAASAAASPTTSASAAVSTGEAPAAAKAKVKVKKFANCTALNKVHKGGAAKAGVKYNTVSGKKRPFTVKPTFSTPLYTANKKMDRDKDGIACEKG